MAAEFRIKDHHLTNDNGHFKLEWNAKKGAVVEVQQSVSPDFHDFTVIYKGIDRATFISGLENGNHYYRIRSQGQPWSPTLIVNVKHQSLKLAFTLFALGAVVFLLTALVVIKGTRQAQTV